MLQCAMHVHRLKIIEYPQSSLNLTGMHVNISAENRAGYIRHSASVHRFVYVTAIVRTGEWRKVKCPVSGHLSQARQRGDGRTVLEHPGDERRRNTVRGAIELCAAVVAERQSGGRFMLKRRRLMFMLVQLTVDCAAGVRAKAMSDCYCDRKNESY